LKKKGADMKKMALGLRLLELRQLHNLTQKQLCQQLNIGRSVYSYYETGARLPSIAVLIKIADYYHITLDEMVGRRVSKPCSVKQVSLDESASCCLLHLRSRHIPLDFLMAMSKSDYDHFQCFLKLTPENKEELQYLTQYKLKRYRKEGLKDE
jgi:transcriptional regulator with XRE-family HTH domain